MRASLWLAPLIALCIWLICVVGPILGAVSALQTSGQQAVEMRSAGALLVTSLGWGALVAILSTLLGWVPGRVLGKSLARGGFVPVAVLTLIPICLPSYVIFYAWWQSWPADTALHRFIIEHGWMQHARAATLLLGLVCWSWPLVAICVAGAAASTPAPREEMLELDSAGWLARFRDRLRCDGAGLALGGVLVFLATINNTTCFDLAEVFTFANELRAAEALGASPAQVLIAGAPAVAIALGGLAAVAWLFQRGTDELAVRVAPPSRAGVAALAAVWIISVALPMLLFASALLRSIGGPGLSEFFEFYGRSLMTSFGLAAISAMIAAIISIGFAIAVQHERTFVRSAANLMLATWLLGAIVPGTILGAAIEAAYNRAGLDVIYRSRIILTIGHLAAFGFVSVLFGRWAALSQPQTHRDMQRLDGPDTLMGFIQSNRPRVIASAVASFAVVLVLSLGEIAVTAQINPPATVGGSPLALSLLNDMHYQRPQTVLMAAMIMLLGGTVAAVLLAKAWDILARSRRLILIEGNRR